MSFLDLWKAISASCLVSGEFQRPRRAIGETISFDGVPFRPSHVNLKNHSIWRFPSVAARAWADLLTTIQYHMHRHIIMTIMCVDVPYMIFYPNTSDSSALPDVPN